MEVCKKVSFCNEQYATAYIEKLNKTSIRERKPIRAYLCEKCFNWHLTSKIDFNSNTIVLENKIIELETKIKNLKMENINLLRQKQKYKTLSDQLMFDNKHNIQYKTS